MSNTQRSKLEKIKRGTVSAFGEKAAALGSEKIKLNVVPTPSLMLDYKLGIGGFPYGAMVEVFGGNGLGKTTVLGYGVLANVQREGKLPALIAMEPYFDKDWALKLHGLDPDLILIQYPDNVQEAFDMLWDLVFNTEIDYILVDSIGAMGNESSQKEGGKKKAYGVSGEVTSGLNDIMPRLYKSNKGLMIVNQQRQTGAFNGTTLYESPGGEALKHHASIRIQLKPGSGRFKATIDGEKDVLVGRELKCLFKKNKLAQAANKSAEFNFFHIETPEWGLGIDKPSDVLNAGQVSGAIKSAGNWLQHPAFPKGKVNGKAQAAAFLREHPEAYEPIREDVIRSMVEQEIELEQEKNAKVIQLPVANDG